MRFLLLSDIHSNNEALAKVIDDAASNGGFDQVLAAGDIVGYGAEPNEVCERLMELGSIIVGGNHDGALIGNNHEDFMHEDAKSCIRMNRASLDNKYTNWLKAAPNVYEHGKHQPVFSMVHGSPDEPADHNYIFTAADVMKAALSMNGEGIRSHIVLHGHTHVPRLWSIDAPKKWKYQKNAQGKLTINTRPYDRLWDYEPVMSINMNDESEYSLINPGSVGQPRDGDWRASYMLIDVDEDTGTMSVTHHRTPYDWKTFVRKMIAAGYPKNMAWRLAPENDPVSSLDPLKGEAARKMFLACP